MGCSRGGGNLGTLKIPREDWGTLQDIREGKGNHHPPLRILLSEGQMILRALTKEYINESIPSMGVSPG